jgi:hypothetical protein
MINTKATTVRIEKRLTEELEETTSSLFVITGFLGIKDV